VTDTTPPPPPAETNYILWGLLGLIVGLAIVVVVLLLASDDGDEVAATTAATSSTTVATTTTTAAPSSTTSAPPSTTTTTTTTAPAFSGDTSDKVADGEPFGTFAFLADIRFAQREQGFTRVVFDFEGTEIPWWAAGYESGPFTNIGDELVPVGGDAFIKVDLSSTSFDLSGEEVRETYEGPRRIPVNSLSVVEIVRLEDFEGVSSWVIGVTGEKPFEVGTLTDPPRVYLDIAD